MNELAKLILVAAAVLPCGALAETFKCADAAGKITYSGKKCSDLGMKDAGEVKDQVNVTPAYKPPPVPPAAARPSPPAAVQPPPPTAAEPQAQEEPKPERRCFTVQTKRGPATRCNDTPEETPDGDKPAE